MAMINLKILKWIQVLQKHPLIPLPNGILTRQKGVELLKPNKMTLSRATAQTPPSAQNQSSIPCSLKSTTVGLAYLMRLKTKSYSRFYNEKMDSGNGAWVKYYQSP